ncbi:MAG: dipeptide epimerase [Verrucomicrobia bacterium]|nr:dipeptide epimerase [Verrucomicrobiota bacterium]
MKLFLREIDLPLRHAFTISQGTTTVQKNLLVELRGGGFTGYGEGASSHAYKKFTAPVMRADLEAARARIEAEQLDDPAALWDRLLPVLGHNRFALCALDEAAHDLWGKQRGAPVWKLWGLEQRGTPLSDYTIGIDPVEKMVAKMREFDGWPIYKIKLGTPDDLAIVRELRRHTDAIFRVDANCAWTVEQALALAPELKKFGVEFIEQPLRAGEWAGAKKLFAESALPIIADESCLVPEDVDRCAGHFHGINVKLTKAGGLTPARRMIRRARELGLQTMVGCMTESSVGISAIAQLLPLLDYVDMDGAVLIAQDIASGVRLEKGRAIFPNENGNGVQLLPEFK